MPMLYQEHYMTSILPELQVALHADVSELTLQVGLGSLMPLEISVNSNLYIFTID